MKKTPFPPFTPDPEQVALMPEVSGNTINGFGETDKRPPSPIYWHHPKQIAHGSLQMWMLKRTNEVAPEVADLENGLGGRGAKARVEINSDKVERSAAEWTNRCKKEALEREADLVGIAKFNQEWVFDGYEIDYPNVIILAVEMDHAELATAPEPASVVEVMRAYNRGTRASAAPSSSGTNPGTSAYGSRSIPVDG